MPKGRKRRPMVVRIKEQTDLALAYANDGAYHTAARILSDIAAEAKAHAEHVSAELDRHLASGANEIDKL